MSLVEVAMPAPEGDSVLLQGGVVDKETQVVVATWSLILTGGQDMVPEMLRVVVGQLQVQLAAIEKARA